MNPYPILLLGKYDLRCAKRSGREIFVCRAYAPDVMYPYIDIRAKQDQFVRSIDGEMISSLFI